MADFFDGSASVLSAAPFQAYLSSADGLVYDPPSVADKAFPCDLCRSLMRCSLSLGTQLRAVRAIQPAADRCVLLA